MKGLQVRLILHQQRRIRQLERDLKEQRRLNTELYKRARTAEATNRTLRYFGMSSTTSPGVVYIETDGAS